LDFIIKAISLGDLATLVVAAQKTDVFGVAELETKEVFEGFDRVVTTVDKVADKDVARVGHFAAYPEKLKQVKKLAVDVTTDCHRGLHRLYIRFLNGKKTSQRMSVTVRHSCFTSRSVSKCP
jgi:hypothetical protein